MDSGAGWQALNKSLCVNLCVKKVPNLTKTCKISKNIKIFCSMITAVNVN